MKHTTPLIILSLWAYFGIPLCGYAQNYENFSPVILNQHIYGGSKTDELQKTLLLPDGNILLAGTSQSPVSYDKQAVSRGKKDFWIVKTDQQGNYLWDKAYGGVENDILTDAILLKDGGFLLGGYSISPIGFEKSEKSVGSDYWIIRLNKEGEKIWDKTFHGNDFDRLTCLATHPDGGYVLGGLSLSGKGFDKSDPNFSTRFYGDYWMIRIDENGRKLWDKTYGGTLSETQETLLTLPNGNILLGGSSSSGISGTKTEASLFNSPNYWLVMTNALGEVLWDETYLAYYGAIKDLVLLPDGNILVGGNARGNITEDKKRNTYGWEDYWILKIDQDGKIIWENTYGGGYFEYLEEVIPLQDGNFLLVGISSSDGSLTLGNKTEPKRGGYDYWIVKINGEGDLLWEKTLGSVRDDFMTDALVLPNGSYFLAGYSRSNYAWDKTSTPYEDSRDFWVLNLEENADQEEIFIYNAFTDKPVQQLSPVDSVDVNALGNSFLTINAEVHPEKYESVNFDLSGPITFNKTENITPYVLFGKNSDTDFKGRNFPPGDYTLRITPYPENNAQGTPGEVIDHSFTVVGQIPDNIKQFVLINADTEQDIQVLAEGDTIDVDALGTNRFSIRAETFGAQVGSVELTLQSDAITHQQIENLAPYALFGDRKPTDFLGKNFIGRGKYTVSATPYFDKDLKGTKGRTETRNFFLKGESLRDLGFFLVDAESNTDVQPIREGDIINVDNLPGRRLGIRLESPFTQVGSVLLELVSDTYSKEKTENFPPYSLFGGTQEDPIFGRELPYGVYTLKVTYFEQADLQGEASIPRIVNFQLTGDQLNIKDFTLINAETEEEIQQLNDLDEINLFALETNRLTIRANPEGEEVQSIHFSLEGGGLIQDKAENQAPFTIFGDKNGDYFGRTLTPGRYTLQATPYLGKGLNGKAGEEKQITFTLVEDYLKGVTIVNTETGEAIGPLIDGTFLPCQQNISFRVDTENGVKEVRFKLNERRGFGVSLDKTEKVKPFTLMGENSDGSLKPWKTLVGNYTLELEFTDGQGTLLQTNAFEFMVTGSLNLNQVTLIDAKTQTEIGVLEKNTMNEITLPEGGISIRADVDECVEAVKFIVDEGGLDYECCGVNVLNRREYSAPYSIVGDTPEQGFLPWMPEPGEYVIFIWTYSADDARGIFSSFQVNKRNIRILPTPNAPSAELRLFPNPVIQDNIQVIIPDEITGPYELLLRDKQGNIFFQQAVSEKEITLDMSQLKPGYHILEVKSSSGVIRKPLIKP